MKLAALTLDLLLVYKKSSIVSFEVCGGRFNHGSLRDWLSNNFGGRKSCLPLFTLSHKRTSAAYYLMSMYSLAYYLPI